MILHHVWLCALPHEHNKVGVSLSDYDLAANALRKTMSCWMEKLNLEQSVKEKMLKAILKDGMIGQTESI
jgi:hypothetical protein